MRRASWLPIFFLALAAPAAAQAVNAARLAILQAEDRRAATAADLATIRAGVRSVDPQTARVAVRALGRLERPSLVPDILPALTSRYSEVRTEAANAVAQAASGVSRGARGGPALPALLEALKARLAVEDDSTVRAALAESIGRLPYTDADATGAAQRILLESAARYDGITDRLSMAKAFEALVRTHKDLVLVPSAVEWLAGLIGIAITSSAAPLAGSPATAAAAARPDPLRDARVRRLALEALTLAGRADAGVIQRAIMDPDPQVRRLATRAAAREHVLPALTRSLEDRSAMVRLEAVRGLADAAGDDACALTMAATTDGDPQVALQAIDRLSACGDRDQAVLLLADFAGDRIALDAPRDWHRPAHALVALAAAAPDRAAGLLGPFVEVKNPFVRVYAARAAETVKDRHALERLSADPNDNVVEAAVDGLSRVAGAEGTPQYVAALQRRGYQAVRAAARALGSSEPRAETIAALTATLDRLVSEGHANATDARTALIATLQKLGAAPATRAAARVTPPPTFALADLRRLAAPRARLTIRGLGVIDVALITTEAPATVLQFARLAEGGYYNGLTIHRVAPNFVLQGGSPDANEYVGHPDYMRDELGLWPHVRGALGISTRGRDTGDAQIFIDLVDNPRLDHEYTVFGQVITGMDVADHILEGDVIESVQILDGR